ncbi:MAG: SBBP repeat-containing protein [Bdellovibrionota bacterium]
MNGNYLWTTQLGNITAPTVGANAILYEVATAISIDNSNNIYISGHTSSNFGEVTGGLFDAFVAKFDTNGSALWITQLGDVTVWCSSFGVRTRLCNDYRYQ